jgi:hypothetical protein
MKLQSLTSAGTLVLLVFATAISTPAARTGTAGSSVSSTIQVRPDNRLASSVGHDGAIVVQGLPCGITVPGEAEVFTTKSHIVITPSGNTLTSCHASTPLPLAHTLVIKDAPCGTLGSTGTDSHLVATRSGRVNFWCHHHR